MYHGLNCSISAYPNKYLVFVPKPPRRGSYRLCRGQCHWLVLCTPVSRSTWRQVCAVQIEPALP